MRYVEGFMLESVQHGGAVPKTAEKAKWAVEARALGEAASARGAPARIANPCPGLLILAQAMSWVL